MKRREKIYPVENPNDLLLKGLNWAKNHDHFHYFNPNNIAYPHKAFPAFITAGAHSLLKFTTGRSFKELQTVFDQKPDWYIGYFGYDLKNETENLTSQNNDAIGFEDIYFYVPQHLIFAEENTLRIVTYHEPDKVFEEIKNTAFPERNKPQTGRFTAQMQREEYLEKVRHIIDHIIEGDFYEMNFCQEFQAADSHIDPVSTYLDLCERSPMPFSVLQKIQDHYLLCASPERFLKKEGQTLISQPIKGTIRRGLTPKEDEALKQELRTDEKELAENMMIVDLVRNDLAKSAETGSVKAEELFGIYTFRQVHQMISTITATLKKDTHFIEAIKAAFPMGSMTGAPKIKVMEMTEKYENSKRGLYSGAVGYISPDGDFDFNVVIRSILYNQATKMLSFQVGGAITYDSVPEKEYEECLLKAKAIREVLGIVHSNN